MDKTQLESLLFALSAADCINSSHEAAQIAMEKIKAISPRARFDRMGNIIAPVTEPAPGGEHLLLDAHIDEIGFVVTHVDEHGFLRVGKVGGVDLRVLQSSDVTVYGRKKLFGVFCSTPPHLANGDKKLPPVEEMAVDIGYPHDKACELVAPGDYVFLRRSPTRLRGSLVTGKALDNRAGVTAVLAAVDRLAKEDIAMGLTVVFSLSEEVGERGATVSSFAAAPTCAVVVDVSHGLTPDSPAEKCGRLGGGPMIGVSPTLSGRITSLLLDTAKREGLPFQREVMSGDTGTNASVVAVSGGGVETGLVSIPLRFMHTAAEVVDRRDVESTADLIAGFIRSLGKNGGKT